MHICNQKVILSQSLCLLSQKTIGNFAVAEVANLFKVVLKHISTNYNQNLLFLLLFHYFYSILCLPFILLRFILVHLGSKVDNKADKNFSTHFLHAQHLQKYASEKQVADCNPQIQSLEYIALSSMHDRYIK